MSWYHWWSRGRNVGKTVAVDAAVRQFEELGLLTQASILMDAAENLISYMSDDDRDVVHWRMEYDRWHKAFEELMNRG